jgi:hypothetical protein
MVLQLKKHMQNDDDDDYLSLQHIYNIKDKKEKLPCIL